MLREIARLRCHITQLEDDLRDVKASSAKPPPAPPAPGNAAVADALAVALRAMQSRAESAEQRAAELEAKTHALDQLFRHEQDQRRRSHNQLLDLKGQIRVFCRVRPLLLPQEQDEECVTFKRDAFTADVTRTLTAVDGVQRQEKKAFMFDAVFGPNSQQEEVFRDVEDLVQSALDGYNVTILAYGQTGAGKTYTMYGGRGDQEGIAPRTIKSIFNMLSRMDSKRFSSTVRAHLVELYRNDLHDLLAPPAPQTLAPAPLGRGACVRLEVRRDAQTGDATIDNVEERVATDAEQLLRILEEGTERRTTASTMMNANSSRSHLFLTVSIDIHDQESKSTVTGKVRLCDLAGSERPKKSGASGDVMREAIEINRALTALGDVIETLTQKRGGPVPYRNHKLTQLLSDSLGGSAKTLMFVNVSPAKSEVEETLNSLTYASRARNIANEVRGAQARTYACRASSPAKPKLSAKGVHRTMEDANDPWDSLPDFPGSS